MNSKSAYRQHLSRKEAICKALKLSSNKIKASTGISIYHINMWLSNKEVPEFVEVTMMSFLDTVEQELHKIAIKLNLK